MLTAIASQFRRMKTRPDFIAHVREKAQIRGNELLKVLSKMMYQKTSREFQDMFDLMLNAHELAEMMYSGAAAEYKFVFPEIGDRFRTDYMHPRDPFPNIRSPEELQQMGATVKLGVTPHITSRITTEQGQVHETLVLKAFVLMLHFTFMSML